MDAGRDFIQWLGEDMSLKILMHLEDPSDLVRTSAVSSSWRNSVVANGMCRVSISVFMKDRDSGSLTKIANYGEECGKDEEKCIKVIFHGYGHYDILEDISETGRLIATL